MNTRSVLLVSSDLDERALLSAALGACAARVIEAARAQELDVLLEREPIALTVVIEQMREDPVLDWAIAALERRPQLSLIVVFDSDVIDARRTQLDADPRALVLSKPVDAGQLAACAAALLAAGPERPASALAPDERANERILALQREFGRELPARLQKLGALLAEARSESAAGEAAMLAHRLRGSAGAYGFGALSQAAGELEELLNRRSLAPLSRGDFARMELALSDMVASSQSAPRSLLSEDAPRSYLGLSPLLVLDDDAEFVRRVRFAARGQFLDSIVARHPRAALAHVGRTPPIAALVGARFEREFPGLCGKLRKVSGCARLPIVLAAPAAELEVQSLLGDLSGALVVSRGAPDTELTELLRKLAFTRGARRQRVLLLSDDAGYLSLLQGALAALDVELRRLSLAEHVLEALHEYAPDLLLLDVSPALGSGLDVCRTLRRSLRFQRLPVVVVGASDAAAMRVPAYQAGASDVVSKQLAPEELAARLGVRLELAGLLEAQAEKDALTGLLNLRSFLEASERALARARRMIDPVSLALLDIDALRAVNTGFGHAAGDDVIAQLGRLVHERFRTSDLRCRWAGGQFALLFDGAGKLDIMAALQRLLADFAGCSFQADRGAMFRATLSAGVAAFPEDGESLHALLVGADQRLCRAKRQGQGQLRNAETSPPRAEAS